MGATRICLLGLMAFAWQPMHTVVALVTPGWSPSAASSRVGFQGRPASSSSSFSSQSQLRQTTRLQAQPVTAALASIDTSSLLNYFLETVIANGVPALAAIAVIAFAAKSFADSSRDKERFNSGSDSPLETLYDDLYGDASDATMGGSGLLSMFQRGNQKKKPPKNVGIPAQEYLSITKLNDRYNSYQYSVDAATRSKAYAAAVQRKKNFGNAFAKALDSSLSDLTTAEMTDLVSEEKEFLKEGARLMAKMETLQIELTKSTIGAEMKKMKVDVNELDPHTGTYFSDSANTTANANETSTLVSTKWTKQDGKKTNSMKSMAKKVVGGGKKTDQLMKQIGELNSRILRLELEFTKGIVEILGPDRANALRATLLGSTTSGMVGNFLRNLQERPLSQMLKELGYMDEDDRRKSIFVTRFPGDVQASQLDDLREEATAIIRSAQPGDEVLMVLESGGGTVTGYGLAAGQLKRFKEKGMKLTICVEQVAASGGYMMCCVADRIVASPFAVLGSIGVISDIPNVYERLKKEGIEFQTITAGKYKRTITPTKKITKEDVEKSKDDINDILQLFKGFVKENRPSLDIEAVATGETWFGTDAMARGLCDEIKTADDVLLEYVDMNYNVYEVAYNPPIEVQSAFGNLLPSGSKAGRSDGIGNRLIKSLVSTVMSEVKEELSGGGTSARDRYMAKDPSNSSDNIRAQD